MSSIIKMNFYTSNSANISNSANSANSAKLLQTQPVIKLGYNLNKPRQCAALYIQGNKTCSSCGH